MIYATVTALCLVCAAPLPADTGLDPFAGAVEVLKYTFEDDDDRDFDGQPDDWTRRIGPGFPAYIEMAIDRTHGRRSEQRDPSERRQSLQFRANGGRATMYSPLNPIDPLHSYVFEGFIRTQALDHDAALISVSFLNHKRQRVQRLLTTPVTGTHADWQRVRIGPVDPPKDTRFVVIGCHLAPGKKMGIHGSAWFDDLWLGRLPQLTLVGDFSTRFVHQSDGLRIEAHVGGLDPGAQYRKHAALIDGVFRGWAAVFQPAYRLRFELLDASGQVVESETRLLEADSRPADSSATDEHSRREVVWTVRRRPHGFYRVRCALERDGAVILEKQTTLAVMDLTLGRESGEFGWSVSGGVESMPIGDLADIAAEAGINWIKYPLWKTAYPEYKQYTPEEINELLAALTAYNIAPVGLLNDPPRTLRSQFADDWTGINEIFTMPPSFWSPSIEPVIARYWSQVRYWQLGDETDASFVGLSRLPETMATVKRELDRVGRDTRVGIHWDWRAPLPPAPGLRQTFLSLGGASRPSDEQIVATLRESREAGLTCWMLVEPMAQSNQVGDDERGADLVKQMVAAKVGGAHAIFAGNVFDKERGLLNPDGSPTPLFLPWRTAALALRGSEFLGSLNLEAKSRNYAFARNGRAVLVIWNDESVVESLHLGDSLQMTDLSGRRLPVRSDEATKQSLLDVGPVPTIIRVGSEPIVRWRLAAGFDRGRIASAHGRHQDTVVGVNTFAQGVNGRVTLHVPSDWEIEPKSWSLQLGAGERFALPMSVGLPANATLGEAEVSLEFEIFADRRYHFRVTRPYHVGLGDVQIDVSDELDEDDNLIIRQIITNKTEPAEMLNFNCSLFVPSQQRQRQRVTKLGQGTDQKLYLIPHGKDLRGREVWLKAEQIDGRRILNKRWILGENWDNLPADAAEDAETPPKRTGTP
jgi:hypothetical protein